MVSPVIDQVLSVLLLAVRLLAATSDRQASSVWVLDSQPGPVAPDQVPDVQRVLDAVQV